MHRMFFQVAGGPKVMANVFRHNHPQLGPIRGSRITPDLVQFRGLPYARVPRRFAHSIICDRLPQAAGPTTPCYDATEYGPCSVQPQASIATDLRWNQLPERPHREQGQSEDCLRITLTCPASVLEHHALGPLPVVAFIHGGAMMIGSGDRQYYDSTAFCTSALAQSRPVVFASINYRLGALGFLHCPEATDYLPPNNGLYDQIVAFEWIRTYIAGFMGDASNVTAIGQSAGAASLSLHSSRFRIKPMYRRAIALSGSTTVLVTMTPEEHRSEFLYQAGRLGIEVCDRSMEDIARDVINAPIDAIRSLEYCGAPCAPSDLVPEADWATMRHARCTRPNVWLESQILCSSTYDGSISHLVAKAQERTQLAKIFIAICHARLQDPHELLNTYHVSENDEDDVALEKICQVVTDIGYYGAVISGLLGAAVGSKTRNYHAVFDIGNPFSSLLEKGRFATHTWDIVSLFGAYDHMLPEDCRGGILKWRQIIVAYCHTGEFPCDIWRPMTRSTLVFRKNCIESLEQEQLVHTQPERVLRLAEQEGGEHGLDLLWEDVIRFFLKTGNPRYSHEASEILRNYDQDPSVGS